MMARFHGRINPSALKALRGRLRRQQRTRASLSQYFDYLRNIVTGNFGISIDVLPAARCRTVIRQAMWWTLGLVGVTTILAFVLGTLIGIVAGWRRGGKLDSVLPPVFVVTSALPYFWVGHDG